MLSHLAALVVSALLFVVVLAFVLKTFTTGRRPRWARVVGLSAALAAIALSAAFALPLLVPPSPVASVTLTKVTPRASLATPAGHFVAVVRGELPPLARGDTVTVPYRVALRRDGEEVTRLAGVLEEHWGQQRVGRRGGTVPVPVAHSERVHAMPSLDGAPLAAELEQLGDALDGPLEVAVVPRPLEPRPVSMALTLLVALTALSDAAALRPSDAAVAVAGIGAFALLLGEGPPSATFPSVATLALLAAVAGLVVARVARAIARRALFRRALPEEGTP